MLEDSGAGKYSFGCSPLSANFEKEYGITLENSSRLMWIAEAVCVSIVFLCLCKLCGRHNGNINIVRIMILVFAASTVIFMIIRYIGHEFWGGFNHVAVPVLLNGMLLAVSLPGIRKVCCKIEE
ncbi:MAG: hypothetical protein Q4C59_02580 [Lachnospiraceae bacterium]|nr:hypothetical protein [Lachnospiraceae bacterium]